MEYQYILEKKHIEKLGFTFDDKARKYFAIQSGWNGQFQGIYKTVLKQGIRYDLEVVKGSEMTERQQEFIIKRCESRG